MAMTKDQILECLANVYDLTNEGGKVQLREVIAVLKGSTIRPSVPPPGPLVSSPL